MKLFYVFANLFNVWILISSSTFSLLQYVVAEDYEENLASHRYIVGKFLGIAEVLDMENQWFT